LGILKDSHAFDERLVKRRITCQPCTDNRSEPERAGRKIIKYAKRTWAWLAWPRRRYGERDGHSVGRFGRRGASTTSRAASTQSRELVLLCGPSRQQRRSPSGLSSRPGASAGGR